MCQLIWKEPQIEDINLMKTIISSDKQFGSDCSYANIFLLRKKYNIKICYFEGMLLRKYNGKKGRRGFGFPIGKGDYKKAIDILLHEENGNVEFCLLSEQQKNILDSIWPRKFDFIFERANSDYIYLQEELSKLQGKKYHKKKNHYSRFLKKYNDMHFEQLTCHNKKDALYVSQKWFEEKYGDMDVSKEFEYQEIEEAIRLYEALKLCGGILYCENMPVAMSIASEVNNEVCDIHFEKALKKYADDGAYAVINKEFANNLNMYCYINREEDIGIEGLRKAKLSYYPYRVYDKYSTMI